MDTSEEMKQANERADEIAAEHQARAQKRDRKIYAFVDDRAAELDRAVTNAKAVASEDTARAREHIEQMRDRARDKAKPPAAHPGT
jgi:gas vesicle protein